MAVISNYGFLVEEAIVPLVLGASDTAVVDLSKKSNLIVRNDTAGILNLVVIGDTATTTNCSGVGDIDLTGGKTFAVGIGETFKFPLNATYKAWLGDGNLTITGGDAAEAYILEV
jgi:hypothetical protein